VWRPLPFSAPPSSGFHLEPRTRKKREYKGKEWGRGNTCRLLLLLETRLHETRLNSIQTFLRDYHRKGMSRTTHAHTHTPRLKICLIYTNAFWSSILPGEDKASDTHSDFKLPNSDLVPKTHRHRRGRAYFHPPPLPLPGQAPEWSTEGQTPFHSWTNSRDSRNRSPLDSSEIKKSGNQNHWNSADISSFLFLVLFESKLTKDLNMFGF